MAKTNESRLFHRWSILLVVLVWPLIWIGGLVTTYDAGMSVPDWPQTYGYNMFLYPWETWFFGPFDLFIEHGHRLLASLVGLLTIGLVIIAYRVEPRRWVRWMAWAALVGVLFQGILGGLRVVLDARLLAMVHGCVGPLYFALLAAIVAVSSRWWQRMADSSAPPIISSRLATVGLALAGFAFIQVVLGAQLRHIDHWMSAAGFRHLVLTHVVMAFVVLAIAFVLAGWVVRCGDLTLSLPAFLLVFLVLSQIGLGLGTWAVNYGWPAGTNRWQNAAGFLIHAKGFRESLVVTAHVATGSLILAVGSWLALRLRHVAAASPRTEKHRVLARQVSA